VIWFRRWGLSTNDPLGGSMLAEYECLLLDARGQPLASTRLFEARFQMSANHECRMLGFAVFPPVTGRQTIRIQRRDGKDSAGPNGPVEFVVDVP